MYLTFSTDINECMSINLNFTAINKARKSENKTIIIKGLKVISLMFYRKCIITPGNETSVIVEHNSNHEFCLYCIKISRNVTKYNFAPHSVPPHVLIYHEMYHAFNFACF